MVRTLVIIVAVALLLPVAGAIYLVSDIPRVAVAPSWSGVGVFAGDRSAGGEVADATNLLVAGTSADGSLDRLALLHLSGDRPHPVAVLIPPALALEVPGTGQTSLDQAWADVGADVVVEAIAGYAALDIQRYVEVDLDGLRPLSFLVGTDACFGPELVAGSATAVTSDALRSPIRAWRTAREAREVFAVDAELGRLSVLGAIWSLRDGTDQLEVLAIPTRETEGRLRALLEPTEMIFQALRTGEELPPYDEIVPEVIRPGDVTVEVLNGAGVAGIAADMSEALSDAGFAIGDVGNASSFDVEVTQVIHPEGLEEEAALLAAHLPGAEVVAVDDPDASIAVLIGADRADDLSFAEVDLPDEPDAAATPSTCW